MLVVVRVVLLTLLLLLLLLWAFSLLKWCCFHALLFHLDVVCVVFVLARTSTHSHTFCVWCVCVCVNALGCFRSITDGSHTENYVQFTISRSIHRFALCCLTYATRIVHNRSQCMLAARIQTSNQNTKLFSSSNRLCSCPIWINSGSSLMVLRCVWVCLFAALVDFCCCLAHKYFGSTK